MGGGAQQRSRASSATTRGVRVPAQRHSRGASCPAPSPRSESSEDDDEDVFVTRGTRRKQKGRFQLRSNLRRVIASDEESSNPDADVENTARQTNASKFLNFVS